MPHRQKYSLASCFTILLFCAAISRAQLPAARLTELFPPGAKMGSSVEVNAIGLDLDDATQIRFSHPGISAKPSGDDQGITQRRFTISVSADVPPGVYEARLVGHYGITNPRAFVVGELPENAGKTSNLPGAPTPLALDSVANGRCTAGQIDYYALELKKGRRVLVECAARAIDSRLLPVMTLVDDQGHEVARSRRGGLLDFLPPEDGRYILRLHDLTYRGGDEFFYRLTAGSRPHLDAIFPPAGEPGSKNKYTLYGRNLPGGKACDLRADDGTPLEKLEAEIEIPRDPAPSLGPDAAVLLGGAGAGVDAIAYRLKSDAGLSNPMLIALTGGPVTLVPASHTLDPDARTPAARKLSLPCEVAGRFYPHDHADVFTFDAAKGDVYAIEVFSSRLGLPTSPELLLQKVAHRDKGPEQVSDVVDLDGADGGQRGKGMAGALGADGRDVSYRLEVKESATYRVTLRDLFNTSEDNPALVYLLSIHKPIPDFRLLAVTAPVGGNNANQNEPTPGAPFLRKSGVVPIRVIALRQDGFKGAIRVEARGLPDFVHAAPATIPPGESFTTLLLTARDNATAWDGAPSIIGTAEIDGKEQTRTACAQTLVWPGDQNKGELPATRLTDQMPLAVSADEIEPLAIEPDKTSFEIKRGAKLEVPLKLKRRIEIKQPIKLRAAGLSPTNNGPELTLAPGSDTGKVQVNVPGGLAPGEYTFYVEADAQIHYERMEPVGGAPAKGKKPARKAKKKTARDAQAQFYSPPITLKIVGK